MEQRLTEIIYNWVGKNFGTQEAEDPSWNIEALAHEIAEHDGELYGIKQEEYDIEDIKMVAEDMEVELSEKELSIALEEYEDEEDTKLNAIPYIIERIKKGR